MPYRINGCGTGFYGRHEPAADGSYMTTNFFCVCYLPILPLCSYRVIPNPGNSWLPFSKNYDVVLEKRWPNPKQVISIYLWAGLTGWAALYYFVELDPLLGTASRTWGVPFFVLSVAIPFFGGLLLRRILLLRGGSSDTARAAVSTAAPQRGS